MSQKFQDSILINSGKKNINIFPGNYHSLNFCFSGAQAGTTAPTQDNLGFINMYYQGKLRNRINFTELGMYNDKKFGGHEVLESVGDSQPFSFNFKLPFSYPDSDEIKIEWIPDSILVTRVSPSSILYVTGFCPLLMGPIKMHY